MATLRLGSNLSPGMSLADFLSGFLSTSEITATSAFFTAGGNASLNIQGTGFDDQGESVVGGTATSVTFFGFGQTIATLTGLNYDTSDVRIGVRGSSILADMMSRNDTVIGSDTSDILEGFRGRDILKGFEGSDVLDGGLNADILVGGSGSDTFEIGFGNDVIKDFDPVGGGAAQDYLSFGGGFDNLRIMKDGDNTILSAGGGLKVTLLHVAPMQINEGDFL